MPDEAATAGPVELIRSFVQAFRRGDLDAQLSLHGTHGWFAVNRWPRQGPLQSGRAVGPALTGGGLMGLAEVGRCWRE